MFRLFFCCILFGAFQSNFALRNQSAVLEAGNFTVGTSCCDDKRTCNQRTSSKLSYFVNPSTFHEDCPLRIQIYSRDVCQIRLDFEEFEIHQPTNTPNPPIYYDEVNGMAYKCHIDKFRVEKTAQRLGFSSLCGRNEGQHIYIPVQQGQSEIVLRFELRRRTPEMLTQYPRWKIKIRQIECSDRSNIKLIAPPNCLQYYYDYRSMFESFNYNNGRGCYIGGLDYSICFRKTSDICSIRYTAVNKFQMNYNTDLSQDRCHPNTEAGECVSQDYIRINEGKLSNGQYKNYYCGQDFANLRTVTSKSHEPLYVKVHTDNYRAYEMDDCNQESEDHKEVGFRITYELEDCYY